METVTETQFIRAVGPYSLARRAGNLLYVSGQVGIDAEKRLVPGGTREEFKQIMANLSDILATAGAQLTDIVKVNLYLTDINEFDSMNEAYATYFEQPFAARTTVQVTALPVGAHVLLDVVALIAG